MMRRRDLIALIGGAALRPLCAGAQPAVKVPRIGYVSSNLAADPHLAEAFSQGLRDLGYAEGRIAIEYRSAEGKLDRFPALVAELVAPSSVRTLPYICGMFSCHNIGLAKNTFAFLPDY